MCIFLQHIYIVLVGVFSRVNKILIILESAIIPLLIIPIWKKNKKNFFKIWRIYTALVIIVAVTSSGIKAYNKKKDNDLKIKTDVNINIEEYMPFAKETKIVKLDKKASLEMNTKLPKIDGAAAVFPVYSAFVRAVYPEGIGTKINNGTFNYNNTVLGYRSLAKKEIDIFFGAYPSKEQIEFATENGTEFEYTEIGKEGFVFFVNKNNPVENLTTEQIKGIYSGKIKNWKEVGGENKEIIAFQRNEGSGSQSMLKRFMGDTEIMPAKREETNDFMAGVIADVADYRNYDNSIGMSFRYYLEEMIANPNVKMISIDGVAPTKENISKELYPIVTSLYAVTYKDNENENVQKLLDWILSEEGQEIVEKTGYAPANNK